MLNLRVDLIYTDGVYTITVGYTIHMQNLIFKFIFELCIIHLMMKVYTLSMYRKLILNLNPPSHRPANNRIFLTNENFVHDKRTQGHELKFQTSVLIVTTNAVMVTT